VSELCHRETEAKVAGEKTDRGGDGRDRSDM